jgi:hypothetical protein
MHKLRETMTKELEAIERKGQLSMSDLDKVHKLTDTIKNIDKIEMLESDGGYSEESNWMADGRMYGTSYARGRGDNAKRDRMGRYSRDGGYSETDMMYARDGRSGNRGGYGGYSRDSGDMRERLEEMMEEATTPKQREAIKRCMHEIDE